MVTGVRARATSPENAAIEQACRIQRGGWIARTESNETGARGLGGLLAVAAHGIALGLGAGLAAAAFVHYDITFRGSTSAGTLPTGSFDFQGGGGVQALFFNSLPAQPYDFPDAGCTATQIRCGEDQWQIAMVERVPEPATVARLGLGLAG